MNPDGTGYWFEIICLLLITGVLLGILFYVVPRIGVMKKVKRKMKNKKFLIVLFVLGIILILAIQPINSFYKNYKIEKDTRTLKEQVGETIIYVKQNFDGSYNLSLTPIK